MDIKELDSRQIDKLLKGITIPSPPQMVADLQIELLNPTPNLSSVAGLIAKDAGLSGGVLKAVNSPAFGLTQKVTSINEAVMLLGLKTVDAIVNTLCLRSELSFANLPKNAQTFLNRFWDSCADIAATAAIIACHNDAGCRDEAYMLGLFHNAGIALLTARFDNYADVMEASYSNTNHRVVDTENEYLDTNHAVIGYFIGKSWNLPAHLCSAIAKHHSPFELFETSSTEDEQTKNLVAILKTAEHVSGFYRVVGRQSVDHEWQSISDKVLNYLGFTQDDYEDIVSRISEMGLGTGSLYY